jgi:3-oxoacyl-[acyl-carrier-protein] synthase-3
MVEVSRTRHPVVLGMGHHVPARILTNHDLEKMVDTSDEWIAERTGIKERHIASPEEATSDFAIPAAQKALEESGLSPLDLDVIICATVTPDNPFPSLACRLQANLGATNAFAFDVSAACSGWIYSLGLASAQIATGMASHVLVVGAETLSKIVDWTDRTTCVLFGDGAGAAVLGPTEDPNRGLLSVVMASDGRRYDLLYQPGGGTRIPASHESVERREHFVHMKGNEVFKFAVRNMVDLARRAADEAGLSVSDVDLWIPHQANQRIIDQTGQRLGIAPEKVYVNVSRYGNTSAASIPIALDEARREGRVADGSLVGVVAFGGGFTYGAAILRM